MTQAQIDYMQLAAAMLAQMGGAQTKYKAVGSAATNVLAHGAGGLMSQYGLSPDVANAAILPQFGLQAKLPLRKSRDQYPLHAVLTGVTNLADGNRPDGPCDDGPVAGLLKLCTQVYTMGRLTMRTPVVDITSVGRTINRGEFTDLQLIGSMGNGSPVAPSVPNVSDMLRTEIGKIMLEFKVSWHREFGRLIYTGNPANNTTNGGYKEFRGLDILINTGYRDAETGVLCPAADSMVRNFGSANITTTAAAQTAIVNEVTAMWRYLNSVARQAGLLPATWVISMPEMLHYELTRVWPIAYYTTSSTVLAAAQTNTNLNVDAGDAIRMRDEMYNGQYLMIDGKPVDVVYDDAVAFVNSSGTYTSPIYFVPMTVVGSQPATYIEYFDYDGPGAAMEVAQALAPNGTYYTTDAGRFLWVKKPVTNYCVEAQAVEESRLRLDFPHLAGRIYNVSYTPLIGLRSPYPSDSTFYDGGKTTRSSYTPSFWAPNTATKA